MLIEARFPAGLFLVQIVINKKGPDVHPGLYNIMMVIKTA